MCLSSHRLGCDRRSAYLCLRPWAFIAVLAFGGPPTTVLAQDCIDYRMPPPTPLVGQANTPGLGEDVAVVARYGYITGQGLHVVDIMNPADPQIVGTASTYSLPRALAVAWPYVYVAGADFVESFEVVNVADPAAPFVVGALYGTGWARRAAMVRSFVLVASPRGTVGRVAAFDVLDPANPSFAGHLELENPWDITVWGSYAYVADGPAGLTILDVSQPRQLTVIGNVDTDGFAEGVAVFGDFVCVCSPFSPIDFRVYDLSNPAVPTFLGGTAIPGDPTAVIVYDEYAYVADRDGSLAVVNVTDPGVPEYLGSVATPSGANAVALAWPNLAVADTFGGLLLYPLQCPETTGVDASHAAAVLVRSRAFPNPFSRSTLIRFELAEPASVQIRIYDLAGRLVRNLDQGILDRGESGVLWDARDNRGARVHSGTYVYQLGCDGMSATGRVVLLD